MLPKRYFVCYIQRNSLYVMTRHFEKVINSLKDRLVFIAIFFHTIIYRIKL